MDEIESLRERCHEFLDHFAAIKDKLLLYLETLYAPEELDTKAKRLAAICGGLMAGRAGCILGQADRAVEQVANAEDILEICAVAMAMGGTSIWSDVSMIVDTWRKTG